MKHKDKLKLARKHMTPEEIKAGISPWQSKWWEARKARKQHEVLKREANQKEASRLRKERLKKEVSEDGR